jgi:hypothetical protein
MLNTVKESVLEQKAIIPVDLAGSTDDDTVLEIVQKYIRLYGILLTCWEEIVEGAKGVSGGSSGWGR